MKYKIYDSFRKAIALIRHADVKHDIYIQAGLATRQWFTQFEFLGESVGDCDKKEELLFSYKN